MLCAVGGASVSVLLLGGGASGERLSHVAHYFSHHGSSLLLLALSLQNHTLSQHAQ